MQLKCAFPFKSSKRLCDGQIASDFVLKFFQFSSSSKKNPNSSGQKQEILGIVKTIKVKFFVKSICVHLKAISLPQILRSNHSFTLKTSPTADGLKETLSIQFWQFSFQKLIYCYWFWLFLYLSGFFQEISSGKPRNNSLEKTSKTRFSNSYVQIQTAKAQNKRLFLGTTMSDWI